MGFFKTKGSKVAAKPQKASTYLGNPGGSIVGHTTPESAVPHNGISYEDLKKDLLESGSLFEDPDFKAVDASMFFSKKLPVKVEWKRPSEIVDDPCLYVGGASRFDIAQGMLGDCWLLAAVAALCQYDSLLHQVVPPEQEMSGDGYTGLFRFRLWQYGRWEEVVVDDRLPTYNGKLVFLHSSEKNEFWSALLEKAYAKLVGNYEALKGGQTSEAMEDFTGGVTEVFDLRKKPDNFFRMMQKSTERQSLMCCSIDAKPNEIEAKCDNGLVKGHAYTVTGVKKATVGDSEVELVRVRNPWGNEREWNGAWSDESEEWSQMSVEDKELIGLNYDDDGEFWMSFEDFSTNFTKVEICMLSPDSSGDSDKKTWAMQINQGSWQNYVSAGGCRNFPDTFHTNPQYIVKLEDPDDDEDVDNCTIVLGLIQKGRRKKKMAGGGNLTIGFSIYELGDDQDEYKENGRMNKEFFLTHKSYARSANFLNSREITGRFSFPPGSYVIIPSTFKANEEGDFVFRMFSEKAHASECTDTATKIEINDKEYSDEENEALDAKLKGFFAKVSGDDDEIDAFELQNVFSMVFKQDMGGKEFSLEACRSMLAMVDNGVRNGKLDYEEFRELWRIVMEWRKSFNEYDADNSGDMDVIELRPALSKLGINLSTPALSSIVLRYSNKNGRVSQDDFVQMSCRIISSHAAYVSQGEKPFTLDGYIMSSVYT